jgi:hypothetical protein
MITLMARNTWRLAYFYRDQDLNSLFAPCAST